MKFLAWDKGGFVLYCKRLEEGQLLDAVPPLAATPSTMAVESDGTQLSMLLDGRESCWGLWRWSVG